MKKTTKREKINLLLSAFLIGAFVVCSIFIGNMLSGGENTIITTLIGLLVPILFGLLVFYATRVGEGKQITRFSLFSLILVVLPSLYFILAYLFEGLPLHDIMVTSEIPLMISSFALGYGIPYTFVSGFELEMDKPEDDEEEIAEEDSLMSLMNDTSNEDGQLVSDVETEDTLNDMDETGEIVEGDSTPGEEVDEFSDESIASEKDKLDE